MLKAAVCSIIAYVILTCLLCTSVSATNYVSGTISSNTVWQTNDTPYVVTADVDVVSGVTLTIEPGVDVQLYSNTLITVHGSLLAQGTTNNAITFSNYPSHSYSSGVHFAGGDFSLGATGVFTYCSFSFLQRSPAVLSADYAMLSISNCTFSDISSYVIKLQRCRVSIVGNVIHDVQGEVNCVLCAGIIASNELYNIIGDNDAIDLDLAWDGPGDSSITVEYNALWEGGDDGIDLGSAPAILRCNIISNFVDKGLSIGEGSDATVLNNLIRDCDQGISIKDGSDPFIANNTVVECNYGIQSYDKSGNGEGGKGIVYNTIVWDCTNSIDLDPDSVLTVICSDIEGASVWPGVGNITNNPQFVDSGAGDYRLLPSSPCLDTGTNMAWMAELGDLEGHERIINGTADMGAYESFGLLVIIPASATEGDGVLTNCGSVIVSDPVASELTVNLESDDTSEATVTNSVTISTGQTNTVFNITIEDDVVLDGTWHAAITASASGYASGIGSIAVHDDETAVLTVDLPETVTEGDGVLTGTGTVTCTEPPVFDVAVSLVSDDTTELTVPQTVTILASQTNATFDLTIVDDTEIDGTQTATITAHVESWTNGFDTIDVLDNEYVDLTVTFPSQATEGDGVLANAGIVGISGMLTTNLVVSLVSDDTSEVTVTDTVTIVVGRTNEAFDLTIVDDPDYDGAQTATVTVSAIGFADSSDSIDVADNDVITLHGVPFDNEETPDTMPAFEFGADDPDGGAGLVYQIQWSMDATFTSNVSVRTSDTDPGFENTEDAGDIKPFTEGQKIRFTVQEDNALSNSATNTAYYWRIRAKGDIIEGGSGVFRQWTTGGSFRVNTNLTHPRWLQTTDEQFDTGTLTETRTSGSNSVQLQTVASGGILSSESFESGWGNWANVGGDDGDWQRDSGGTPSDNTGPSSGQDGAWYVFIETSSGNPMYRYKTAYLEGPDIDADTYNAKIDFWYHMYGLNQGSLHLDVHDGTWHNDLWSQTGDQGDQWFNQEVDLSAYSGTIKARFRVISGSSYRSDTALDNIVITGKCSSVGTYVSQPLDHDGLLGANGWDELLFTDDESGGDIKYDVQYWDGDSWENTSKTNQDSSPVDISGLDPATYNRIRIKATITGAGGTPYLNDWAVTWQPLLSLWIDDVAVDEGAGGPTNAAFTVTMSAQSSSTVAVQFATSDGSAVAEDDYASTNGTLIIIPSQTSGTINVTVNGDLFDEMASENFYVNLTSTGNVMISDGQGLCTIIDDDTNDVPTVSNAEGATNVTATNAWLNGDVISTGSAPTEVYVYWSTSDGGTTNAQWGNTNYFGTNGVGLLTTNVTGLTANCTYYYRFYAMNSNGYSWADSTTNFPTGLATIEFAATNSSDAESIIATNLWLTLSMKSGADVTVGYSVIGGTASGAGIDFTLVSGTATITAGNTSGAIALEITSDYDYELDETIIIGISNAMGAVPGTKTNHTYTIFNDDGQPAISINDTGLEEGDSGTNNAVFVVALSATSYEDVMFDFGSSNGTATVTNEDYAATAGTGVMIPAGQISTSVTVQVYGDTEYEPDEHFYVVLSNAINTTILDELGLCTITNDDSPDVIYVSTNGTHESPYASWTTAATNIQAAVNVGFDGILVLVSNGTYVLSSEISIGKDIIVRSLKGPLDTIVDASGSDRCFYLSHSNAVVDGFTITGGQIGEHGGGVYCNGGTVRNCVITNNQTTGGSSDGGGIYCRNGGVVDSCIIIGNSAGDDGGGVQNGNDGVNGGTIRNCLITGNSANDKAGGGFCWPGGVYQNCTICGNSANLGGGVASKGDGAIFRNTIIYTNSAGNSDNNWHKVSGSVTYSYCCTVPSASADSITNDPQFVNAGAGNYRVQFGSLCINNGTNESWMTVAPDLDKKPRIMSGTVDMGAYEYGLPIYEVGPKAETDPVLNGGDAADDMAIWIHPWDRSLSLIIGTDCLGGGGLILYNLDGTTHTQYLGSAVNNVDVRYNFPLGGEWVDLVSGGCNQPESIVIYKVDPVTRTLIDVAARTIPVTGGDVDTAYGYCMYRSPSTDEYYVFVNDYDGDVEQWKLYDNGSNRVDATNVRAFSVGSKTEGMVADDELGYLYIAQEAYGIWKYGAEPGDGTSRTLVDTASLDGPLIADIEGLTIYYAQSSNGYLIASSQGDSVASNLYKSTFAIYERGGMNNYIRSFRIIESNGIDEVTTADGIDVINMALGTSFPFGMFVSHDDINPGYNQNLKMVSWQDIAQAVIPNLVVDTSWDPRVVSAPASNYMITAVSGPYGTIAPFGVVWVEHGSNKTFTVTPDTNYHILDVLVNGISTGAVANYTFVNVTNNQSIEAFFGENLATNDTPEWWLASHYPDTNDFDSAALSDTDGDGMAAWKEYRAGTDPTNKLSVFCIADISCTTNERFSISFTSVSGKIYRVWSASNIVLNGWDQIKYATNLEATLQSNSIPGIDDEILIYVEPSTTPQYYRIYLEP